jgi:hypothetical protein
MTTFCIAFYESFLSLAPHMISSSGSGSAMHLNIGTKMAPKLENNYLDVPEGAQCTPEACLD